MDFSETHQIAVQSSGLGLAARPGSPEVAPGRSAGALQRYLSTLAGAATLTAIYVATARLGLSLRAVDGVAAPVWPPTGISLAALLLFGNRLWPGIACGALLINLSSGVPLLAAAAIAAGNTLEAVLASFLLRRVGFHPALERLRDVLALIVCGAFLSTLVSATIGVTSAWLGGAIGDYTEAWLMWWIGDAVSDLVVAPVLLTWAIQPRLRPDLRWYGEVGSLLVLLGISCVLTFGQLHRPVAWSVFPFMIWAALRCGQRGTTAAVFVTSAVAVWLTAHSRGIFAAGLAHRDLALAQIFVLVVSCTGLVLAAAVSDRRRAEEARHRSDERFHALVENSDDAIALVDSAGVIIYASAASTRIHGSAIPIGQPAVESVHPDDRRRTLQLLAESVRAPGEVMRLNCRVQHRSGSWRWVEGAITNLLDDESVRAIVVNYRDVTERKLAEDELQATQRQLQIVTQTMAAAVARCSRDLRYLWVSPGYAAWLLRPRDEIVDHPIVEILGEKAFEAIRPYVERVLAGESVEYEDAVNYPGLGVRWIHAAYTPTFNATGAVDGWVAVVMDITSRKDLERKLATALNEVEARVLQRTAELHAANQTLSELSRHLLTVRDEERRRIGHELHEGAAQTLAGVKMSLTHVQRAANLLSAPVQTALAGSLDQIDQCCREIRALSQQLHPPLLEEIGLAAAVQWYADGFAKRSGVVVEVDVAPALGRLPPQTETALFRIVQDCLTTASRCAGESIRIQILRGPDGVKLTVEDAASKILAGFAEKYGQVSVGIMGLHERVQQVGGELTVRSGHRGTVVTARVSMAASSLAQPL